MKRDIRPLACIFILLAFTGLACGANAPANDNIMLPATALLSSPTPSRTPDPLVAAQAAAQVFTQQTESARQDLQLAIEKANADSTLIAAQARSTQLAAQQTAIVAGTQAAQTQVAYAATQQSIQFTQAAQATATSFAIQIAQANLANTQTVMQANFTGTQAASTSTAQVQQARDAFAGTATQSAFSSGATVEAASVAALATAQAARARNAEAAAERVEMTNQFMAWMQALAPILAVIIFAAIIYVVGWLWWRINKVKILHPNAQGAYPIVYDDSRLLNAQRAFGPVVDPINPAMPQDETIQGRIAVTDTQVGAVRAIAAGNGSPAQVSRRVQNAMSATQKPQPDAAPKPAPFQVLSAQRAQQILPSGLREVIDADWREETGHGSD